MSRLLFTSDHHFGKSGIAEKRGFRDWQDMARHFVTAWNQAVAPDDDVWHLGDLAYKCRPETIASIFASLNGRKHLVIGNHDREDVLSLPWASPPVERTEVEADGTTIVLDHYPLREWRGYFRGFLHLHGHTHGNLPGTDRSLDVAVDCWDWGPVDLPRIRERLAMTPAVPGWCPAPISNRRLIGFPYVSPLIS